MYIMKAKIIWLPKKLSYIDFDLLENKIDWDQKHLENVGNYLGASTNEADKEALKKPLTKIEKDRVVVLFISFLLVIVFWGAFEQAGGLMNIYASEKTNRMLMGWEVPASWFQSLNAMFIIFLGTSVALYWANRKLKGKLSTSLFKMILGLIIMGAGFFFMTAAAGQYESNGSYWLIYSIWLESFVFLQLLYLTLQN